MMVNEQIAEQRKINLALHAGLMDGISAIKAEQGEVLLFDVQTNSLVGGEGLKDSGEGHYFIQEPLTRSAPPVILPAAIYLTIMQANGNPDDVILEDSNTTLEYAFAHGIDDAIRQSLERYIPESKGCYLQSVIMLRMGLLALEPDDERPKIGKTEAENYQELKDMLFLPDNMMRWMNAVARGEDLDDNYEKVHHIFNAENVKKLRDMLRLSVTDGLASGANSDVVPISGITYVSLQNKERRRRISFCGYFPSDNPIYGIYVELIRKEQLEDPIMDEWPELGKGAAIVCKTVAEMFVKQGQKHLQTINHKPIEGVEGYQKGDSIVPVVKEVTVKSVDGIGITF